MQRVNPHRRRAGVPLVTLPAQLLLVLAVGVLPRTEARQHCRRHRIVDTGGAARRAAQLRISGPRAREAVRVEAVRLVTAELHVGAVLALVERL